MQDSAMADVQPLAKRQKHGGPQGGGVEHLPARGLGVDLCLVDMAKYVVPACAHGPALLFERFIEGGPSKRFFACSACRGQ